MKKIFLCFVLLPLLFSCDVNNWGDTVIRNTSGFDVTFKFSNTEQIDLPDGEQAVFPAEAYQRLESYSPEKRVFFTYSSTNDGYTGEFHALESWTVKVMNSIGEKATLSADGWMDDIEEIAGGSDDRTGKIYTEDPDFTVTETESGFPAIAAYYRDEEGVFSVKIQWGN